MPCTPLVKVFDNTAPVRDKTTFGSFAQNGEPTFSSDVNAMQTKAYEGGWSAAIEGNDGNPLKEDFNALGYVLSSQIKYMYQMGVPTWNS
jgi:hypothetical protein